MNKLRSWARFTFLPSSLVFAKKMDKKKSLELDSLPALKKFWYFIFNLKNFRSEKAVFKEFEPEKDCFLVAKISDLQDQYCITDSF